MKLFGRDLFVTKSMYDFAQHGLVSGSGFISIADTVVVSPTTTLSSPPKEITEKKVSLTPKGVYELQSLNDNKFVIKVDTAYLDKSIADCRKKLALLPGYNKDEKSATRYGRKELQSIIERLENRKKIKEAKALLEKYPHTTSQLIDDVIKANNNLAFRLATEFVPDFPSEAIEAMKEYNEMCKKLCGKETHFYVVSDKKDFQQVGRRRDPILLAQSPFGFFWQILGAWDDEMIYLGDL